MNKLTFPSKWEGDICVTHLGGGEMMITGTDHYSHLLLTREDAVQLLVALDLMVSSLEGETITDNDIQAQLGQQSLSFDVLV